LPPTLPDFNSEARVAGSLGLEASRDASVVAGDHDEFAGPGAIPLEPEYDFVFPRGQMQGNRGGSPELAVDPDLRVARLGTE
jgi:hypothetical protein